MSTARVHAHRFEGQRAIVTGASRGIGLAIAHRLVAEGAKVCITARKPDPLQDALDEFPAGSAIAIAGKADDAEHRAEVFDTMAERFGQVDILVNNAGINPVYGTLMELDLDAGRKISDVNVMATLAWTQDLYRHESLNFAERGGAIVNVSSISGQTPAPGIGFYGISKAAIGHLTRTLGVEMGPKVRVNAVAPAVVKTQFAKALYEGREAEVAAQYPLQRLGTGDDVAAAVAFLASSDASWITAQVLNLDGGLDAAGGTA